VAASVIDSAALQASSVTPADVVSAPETVMYAVQVRYPRSEWVTLARLSRCAALRAAATAYRDALSPDGWSPYQVRLLEL
jgi:hypothetical protein